jgi:hypothetical protein
MQQGDVIVAIFNGIAIADLLISPVALIYRIEKDPYIEGEVFANGCLVAFGESEILRRIVDDQDVQLVTGKEARRDPADNARNRCLGLIRGDKNEYPLFTRMNCEIFQNEPRGYTIITEYAGSGP